MAHEEYVLPVPRRATHGTARTSKLSIKVEPISELPNRGMSRHSSCKSAHQPVIPAGMFEREMTLRNVRHFHTVLFRIQQIVRPQVTVR